MKKITIIIPTYNESMNIRIMLKNLNILSQQINCSFNVLIIDGYSKDNTINIAKFNKRKLNLKIYFQSRLGGPSIAIMDGIKKSKDQFILILDADNPVNIKDIRNIVIKSNCKSLVIGSRFKKKSKVLGVSKIKIFFSILFTKFISTIFIIDVTDSSHSLRCFPKSINFSTRNLYHPMFFWEHTIFCNKKKLFIKEVPITYKERVYGKTNLELKKLLFNVIKAILNFTKLLRYV